MFERRFRGPAPVTDGKAQGETSLPRVADAYAQNAGDNLPVLKGEIVRPEVRKSWKDMREAWEKHPPQTIEGEFVREPTRKELLDILDKEGDELAARSPGLRKATPLP